MTQTDCPCCGRPFPTGQAQLTKQEISRLPMGNQHTKWNIIRWQVVKGAAMYYEVPDWTSKVDTDLSCDENVALMAQKGTNVEANGGKTMRKLAPEMR